MDGFRRRQVEATYGASGLLRDRIEKGERADVFASADVGTRSRSPAPDVRGRYRCSPGTALCAVDAGRARDDGTLLDRMLDPAMKLGMSTPRADPSGDYALELFERAGECGPASTRRSTLRH